MNNFSASRVYIILFRFVFVAVVKISLSFIANGSVLHGNVDRLMNIVILKIMLCDIVSYSSKYSKDNAIQMRIQQTWRLRSQLCRKENKSKAKKIERTNERDRTSNWMEDRKIKHEKKHENVKGLEGERNKKYATFCK